MAIPKHKLFMIIFTGTKCNSELQYYYNFYLPCIEMTSVYLQVPQTQILLSLCFATDCVDAAVSLQLCAPFLFVSCSENWLCLLFFFSPLVVSHSKEAVIPDAVFW